MNNVYYEGAGSPLTETEKSSYVYLGCSMNIKNDLKDELDR